MRAPHLPIPEDLARLCDQALQPSIGDRVASAQDFLQALREHLSGASRQRASIEVTQRLKGAIDTTPSPNYEILGKWQADLSKARVDWPDNPALDPLSDRVQHLYSSEALAKGDISLAIVQAERITDEQRRATLLNEANSLRERRRRFALQRRVAVAAVYVLMLLLVAGVLWHLSDVQRRNAKLQMALVKADSASNRAREAQSQGEQLVAFLLDDLRAELEPLGKLAVLNEVGDQVLAYFDARAAEERTPELVLRHASALRWKAAILLREGNLEAAAEYGAKALAMLGTVKAGHANLPDMVIEQTRVLLGLATAKRRRGDLDGARNCIAAAKVIHGRLVGLDNPPAELRRSFIEVLNDEAGLMSTSGRYADALPIFEEARDRALQLQNDDEPTTTSIMLVARCHTNVGRMLVFLERLEEAHVEFRKAEAVWRDLITRDLENGMSRYYLAVLLANKGSVERRLGQLDAAERTLDERLNIMRALAQQDLLNLDWQRGLSLAHGGVATIQQTRGQLTQALENYRRNLAILEALLARNPTNAEWRLGLARTHLEVATVLRHLGQTSQSAAHIGEAMQAISMGKENSQGLREWNEAHANAFLARGWLKYSQARVDEAIEDIAALRAALASPQSATIPTATLARLKASTDMLAARVAISKGLNDQAADLVASAWDTLTSASVPLDDAYENRLLYAQLLLTQANVAIQNGQAARAETHFHRAREILSPLLEAGSEPRGRLVLYEALGLGDEANVRALEAWFAEHAMRDPEIERLAAQRPMLRE